MCVCACPCKYVFTCTNENCFVLPVLGCASASFATTRQTDKFNSFVSIAVRWLISLGNKT